MQELENEVLICGYGEKGKEIGELLTSCNQTYDIYDKNIPEYNISLGIHYKICFVCVRCDGDENSFNDSNLIECLNNIQSDEFILISNLPINEVTRLRNLTKKNIIVLFQYKDTIYLGGDDSHISKIAYFIKEVFNNSNLKPKFKFLTKEEIEIFQISINLYNSLVYNYYNCINDICNENNISFMKVQSELIDNNIPDIFIDNRFPYYDDKDIDQNVRFIKKKCKLAETCDDMNTDRKIFIKKCTNNGIVEL